MNSSSQVPNVAAAQPFDAGACLSNSLPRSFARQRIGGVQYLGYTAFLVVMFWAAVAGADGSVDRTIDCTGFRQRCWNVFEAAILANGY